jgi:hypothetical protein
VGMPKVQNIRGKCPSSLERGSRIGQRLVAARSDAKPTDGGVEIPRYLKYSHGPNKNASASESYLVIDRCVRGIFGFEVWESKLAGVS